MQLLRVLCLAFSGASYFQAKDVSNPQIPDAAMLDARKAAVVKVTSATGTGSGFLVRSDGTVVTAYHVISGADSIWIHLASGKAYRAAGIIALHPEKDIAILKVQPEVFAGVNPIPIAFGMPASSAAGDKGAGISVIGYPGGNSLAIADGTYLLTRRNPDGLIHFVANAAAAPGFSGGPMLNRSGQAIGVAVVASQNAEVCEAVDINAALPLPPAGSPVMDVSDANKAYEDSADYLFATGYNVLAYWRDEEERKKVPPDALEWALSRFTLACAKRPGFSLALVNKAYCESRLKRYDKAMKSYREAIDVCPEDLVSRYSISALYSRLGRNDDALRETKAALKIGPHFAGGYVILSGLLQAAFDDAGAAGALESAVKLKPENESYRIALARIYVDMHKGEKALVQLKAVIERRPESVNAHYLTGLAYSDMMRHRDAIEAHTRAIHIDTKHADSRFQLGCEYVLLGEYDKAREQYKALVGIDPKLAARLLPLLRRN